MRKALVLALGLLFLLAFSAAAKSRQTLKLSVNSTVGGTELKPGDYTVEVGANEIAFFKGKKEVARSPFRSESVPQKYVRNTLVYEGSAVTEVRLGGSNTKLLLEGGQAADRPAKTGRPGKSGVN